MIILNVSISPAELVAHLAADGNFFVIGASHLMDRHLKVLDESVLAIA